MLTDPFIAVTDRAWFDYLTSISTAGVVDEVNFWSPEAQKTMKSFRPGEPVFFKLKAPTHCIAGYGFFAHFALLDLDVAWDTFGVRNGFPDRLRFLRGLGAYRAEDLQASRAASKRLACTILRDAVFWPEDRWMSWGTAQGWPMNVTRGAATRDPILADLLLRQIQLDQHEPPEEFALAFELSDVDEREVVLANTKPRVGQGAFRSRLITAYEGRCAISGERTEPVLDAAHVQPYLGPRSNHIQNGLLLTQEFHTLFDRGYITVTPEHTVRVSSQIRERWSNGKRFYDFNDQPLRSVPKAAHEKPSADALLWHNKHRFAS